MKEIKGQKSNKNITCKSRGELGMEPSKEVCQYIKKISMARLFNEATKKFQV